MAVNGFDLSYNKEAVFALFIILIQIQMIRNIAYTFIVILGFVTVGCIEDGISTSTSDVPSFSVDTVKIGTVYTDELSPTHRFVVYNRGSKGISISHISMAGEDASRFRLNVDGFSGTEFRDVEIRAKDSIYMFIDVTLPENGSDKPKKVEAKLEFLTNGVSQTLPVSVYGQDVTRISDMIVTGAQTLTPGKPYRVMDSVVVAEGTTLTLQGGTRMLMHDKARLVVRGTLKSEGDAQNHVVITGDRVGEVIPDVSFDIMSRQWGGVEIYPTSKDNVLRYTEISNTTDGVQIAGDGSATTADPMLTMINCRLRNSGSMALMAQDAAIVAYGCELADAADGIVYVSGGDYRFDRCTVSNQYLFAVITQAAWQIDKETPTKIDVTNSITWGIGSDVAPGDLKGMDAYFRRCMFKSKGEDDDNFVNCMWDADPLFYTVREDYVFDYRLRPDSPAIGAADEAFDLRLAPTDWYGVSSTVPADLGAYNFTEAVQ